MKKSQVDLAQLKAGVGAKLKRKREPISPAGASSSKKKVAEKEAIEDQPALTSLEKDNAAAARGDPPNPSPLTAFEETEKRDGIKGEKTSTSTILGQSSIPTPQIKDKFTNLEDFCRSMKSALINHPLESGYDIISQSTNYYREQAEVGTSLQFQIFSYSCTLSETFF